MIFTPRKYSLRKPGLFLSNVEKKDHLFIVNLGCLETGTQRLQMVH